MPVSAVWANETHTAIILTFEQPWDWPEFHAADEQAQALKHEVSHTVHWIMDFRAAGPMPQKTLAQMNHIGRQMQGDSGRVYIVGANALLTALGSIMRRLLPDAAGKVQPVESLERALALIADHESTR